MIVLKVRDYNRCGMAETLTMRILYLKLLIILVGLSPAHLIAQATPPKNPIKDPNVKNEVEIKFKISGPEEDPFHISEAVKQYQDQKKVAALRKKYCKLYDKKYISYYETVYWVESCKVKEVDSSDMQYELTKTRKKITPVESEVIAVIPQGDPMSMGDKKKLRKCKDLEGRYVTFSDVDVYLVQKCKLRMFTDWESYIAHRNKRKTNRQIIQLNWEEFGSLEEGDEMDSVLDEEFAKLARQIEKDVDIIPVDEACAGLNGKTVSFYSRMYKIQKCRKHELDPEKFWKIRRHAKQAKIQELTSEQWISLPNGKPIDQMEM